MPDDAIPADVSDDDALTVVRASELHAFAAALLGKHVTAATTGGLILEGQVTGLHLAGHDPRLYVDGKAVALSDIQTISYR